MADELHVLPQHYIRAKVILGGLSLAYGSGSRRREVCSRI